MSIQTGLFACLTIGIFEYDVSDLWCSDGDIVCSILSRGKAKG